jgi:hypothetical protein
MKLMSGSSYVLHRFQSIDLRVVGFQGHSILCMGTLGRGKLHEFFRIDSSS